MLEVRRTHTHTLKLPFVSRSAHNELVNLLKEEISELKAERKETLNYILQQAVGRNLFGEVIKPVPIEEVGPGPGFFAAPINETVRKNPRAALRKLQEEVNQEADELLKARQVVDRTIAEGQAAAE